MESKAQYRPWWMQAEAHTSGRSRQRRCMKWGTKLVKFPCKQLKWTCQLKCPLSACIVWRSSSVGLASAEGMSTECTRACELHRALWVQDSSLGSAVMKKCRLHCRRCMADQACRQHPGTMCTLSSKLHGFCCLLLTCRD